MEEFRPVAIQQQDYNLIDQALEFAQKALYYDQKDRLREAIDYYKKAVNILENDAKTIVRPKMAVFQLYIDSYKSRIKILETSLLRRITLSLKQPETLPLDQISHAKFFMNDNKIMKLLEKYDDYEKITYFLNVVEMTFTKGAFVTKNLFVPYYIWYSDSEETTGEFSDLQRENYVKLNEILSKFNKMKGKPIVKQKQDTKDLRASLIKLYKENCRKLMTFIDSNPVRFADAMQISGNSKLSQYKSMIKKNWSKIYNKQKESGELNKVPKAINDLVKTLLETIAIFKENSEGGVDLVYEKNKELFFALVRDIVLKSLFYDIKLRVGQYYCLMRSKYFGL